MGGEEGETKKLTDVDADWRWLGRGKEGGGGGGAGQVQVVGVCCSPSTLCSCAECRVQSAEEWTTDASLQKTLGQPPKGA